MYDLYEDEVRVGALPNERPTTGRPRRKRGRVALALLGGLLLVALLAVGGGLFYLNQLYEGRIYPNIAVNGIDVGQKTPEEALAALEGQLEPFLDQPVTLSYGGQSWQPTLDDLGVSLDFNATVEEAYETGRRLNLLSNVEQVYQTWQTGLNLPVKLTIDGPRLKRYLESITAGINKSPADAGLVIANDSATLTPAQEGRLVLIDDTAQDLLAAIQTLQPQEVAIRTEMLVPRLRDAGVADAQRTVDSILQGPITLTAPNLEWELTQDELRALIRLERVSGEESDQLLAEVDEVALRQKMATIADEIGRGSVNPRVNWNNGNLVIVKPGQSGLRLDEEASAVRVAEQLTSSERTIELVVNEVQPEVTEENLHELGIVEAVGVGRSSFKGSAPYRVTNIKAGSRLLDGILIAPGEEFSFNNTVGSIDERNGFVEGYAIIGNRTQLEFGGGICQDSTTLFRAAFYAGLPITEWHYHSFRISWYEVYEPYGMDATIFTGALDFKFVNDTGNWLLLQTYVDEQKQDLTYVLYGTKPNGRQVVRTEPVVTNQIPAPVEPVYVPDASIPVGQFKQTDTARGGMTITIYRIITENGVEVLREPYVTKFKPWPNIYLHNPRTPLPKQGCLPGQACAQPEPEPTPEPTQAPPPPVEQPTQAPPPPVEQPTQAPPPPAEQPTQAPPPPPPAEQPTQAPPPPPPAEQPTQAPPPPPPAEQPTQAPPADQGQGSPIGQP